MRRAIVLVGAVAAGCADLPEVTAEGQHIRVASDPGLELCGGSMAHMDAFVAGLSAELGTEAPTGDDRVLAYWLDPDSFLARSGCSEGSGGCASLPGSTFYARALPLNHEIVHVVASQSVSVPALTEGLADAYEGLGARIDVEGLNLGDVAALFQASSGTDLDAAGYSLAGNFTAFLIERHGLSAFVKAMEAITRRASQDAIDRRFRDFFGGTLAATIVEFDFSGDFRYCGRGGYDAKLVECSAPELEWRDGRIAEYRALACDQPDAVGPYGGSAVVVFHTLTIATSGEYTIELFGDASANKLAIRGCGGCESDPGVVAQAGGRATTEWLEAGRYTVRLFGTTDRRTSVGFRITPAAGLSP